ncbi:PLD nuclease N-terminal domain-containing protein [Oceanobacillus luteolus]|uniref:PLD nuclease N-terminal domain-containing protein n=1 Tax=Oceanobacillus luteolus TaxID=1274358 RepID=A0ABW4HPE8_9BACI|nr:PLD nuclease N-terminal domain-containing protein [Oceanobacillus luteolus]MCM3739524.1 PLD nuclease N-terminal domain-containing protein [Oceanobacillus luteolus]
MESLAINWQLILPLFFIQGILLIVGILDWAKQGENVRGNRWVWFVVIVFINIIGPILYFIFGRRR